LHTHDFEMEFLNKTTLQGMFRILYDDFRTHIWEPPPAPTRQQRVKSRSSSTPQQKFRLEDASALEELLIVLEPSVWKVFGYSSAIPEQMSSLQDVIDVLLSPSSRRDDHSTSRNDSSRGDDSSVALPDSQELFTALFPEEYPDDFSFDESDDYYYDDDDDEYEDNETHLQSGRATWAVYVDMDSDLSVVGVTRVVRDEDEEDWDSDASTVDSQTIYTRSMLPAQLPDVVHQLEQVVGKPLQYSKGLERDLFQQLADAHERDF